MVRRLLLLALLALTLPSEAATRWLTDRAGASVQWQEWGPAALERARKQQRPVFLSIGFAASYDGLRMHQEAFASRDNAAALNAHFVPILLDRIEHPEAAEVFEHLLKTMNGAQGWPANLVLTPSLEPFDGALYMDAAALHAMLTRAADRWKHEPQQVSAEAHAHAMKARVTAEQRGPAEVDVEAVVDAIAEQRAIGPMTAGFLFRYAARTKHEPLRTLAADTLTARALSAERDQLGGGFHRCAGCYEKLLSDQAVAALAYVDAWQLTKDPALADVAKTTLDYALRDLRFPKAGAFEASQDAYSLVPAGTGPRNVEGAFYRWTKEELAQVAGHENARKVLALYADENLSRISEGRFFSETYDELAAPLQKLLDHRQKRPAPFREPLIVAGWNGLMISALSRAAVAFQEPRYREAAQLAAAAVTAKLWDAKKQTLMRTDSGAAATADDYALLVQGLLDLFGSSHDVKWLDLAVALQSRQDQLFWDASLGRYATGSTLPESLRGLLTETDVELPSANSASAVNLLRLAALTGNQGWRERPAMIFHSFGRRLSTDGARLPGLATAYELSLVEPRIVVVTGDLRKQAARDFLRAIEERYEPMRAVVFLPDRGPLRARVTKSLPFTAALEPDPELPIAYECAKGECRRQ
ncbi:MAG TPA: DUF255 domain-containing protein [Thermoanaerobaculia bacterium]|jgi:hypothetical protein